MIKKTASWLALFSSLCAVLIMGMSARPSAVHESRLAPQVIIQNVSANCEIIRLGVVEGRPRFAYATRLNITLNATTSMAYPVLDVSVDGIPAGQIVGGVTRPLVLQYQLGIGAHVIRCTQPSPNAGTPNWGEYTVNISRTCGPRSRLEGPGGHLGGN